MVSSDTLEEKLINMKQNNLNTKDLKSLIQYKASKILCLDKKGTLDFSVNIEDIINNTVPVSTSHNNNEDTEIVKPKEIYNKRYFRASRKPRSIRYICCIFYSNDCNSNWNMFIFKFKIMPYILPNWSKQSKENIVIVIGVGIAHIIG